MEITWDGLFKGLKCIVLCNYYSLIDFVAVLKELIPTRWTWHVHVLQNSNGNWEGNTYHYINPGGSFGKPVLTSFCLGLPFCKMWLVGFPTVFRIILFSTCDKPCNYVKCFIILFFMLHPAPIHHWLLVMVKEPCQRAFAGFLEVFAGNMIQFLCISPSCSDATVPQLDLSCCLGTVRCV